MSTMTRMIATKHAPRGPFRLFERRHSLAEIVERGGGVLVERSRKSVLSLSVVSSVSRLTCSRHGNRFAQHRLGFFEAS